VDEDDEDDEEEEDKSEDEIEDDPIPHPPAMTVYSTDESPASCQVTPELISAMSPGLALPLARPMAAYRMTEEMR